MGTAATATLLNGPHAVGGEIQCQFELTLDTTTAGGLMTIDVTSYFDYVTSAELAHSDAANFYYVEPYNTSDYETALTSTSLGIGISEAGADGAPLDLVASTDMSSAITGLILTVRGKGAIATSWE